MLTGSRHPERPARVVICGQGYVGLPLAMEAVEAGHDVVGFDRNTEKVKSLCSGRSYVEDISDERLQAALDAGRYLPTSDVSEAAGFDVAVISVPTPLSEGAPDLSYIERAARDLGPYLTPGATVVLESTTYPGTTEELVGPILESESGLSAGADFHLGYSPERIDPGNPVYGLRNVPKIVSGIDERSLTKVKAFFDTVVDETVPVASTRVAEMSKLLENTFRHVNIALVNELTMFAEQLGVDVWEAISAASTKPYGFMPFRPGPGVGGHCLPIDPSYLSWKVKQALGSPFRVIELANDINDHMPDYVVRRVTRMLNGVRKPVNGSRVLVLGLAYKRNTGDARESPGPVICTRLRALGAEVRAVDPHVPDIDFPSCAEPAGLTRAELETADIVVIATDHDAFDWDLVQQAAPLVFDTRHRLSRAVNVEFL